MKTSSTAPNLTELAPSDLKSSELPSELQRRPSRTAIEWHKPKRKRGRDGSKDSRRRRLEWRNLDKEWRIFQQRWMKPSKKPGKKPPVIIQVAQFKP